MVDLAKDSLDKPETRVLEPACGNGNFLIEILNRKLDTIDRRHGKRQTEWEQGALLTVTSLYGVDIQSDNAAATRTRLCACVMSRARARFGKKKVTPGMEEALLAILSVNIVHGDALSMRSLNPSEPLQFTEWSMLGAMVKRRVFSYANLVDREKAFIEQSTSKPTKKNDSPNLDKARKPSKKQTALQQIETTNQAYKYVVHPIRDYAPVLFMELASTIKKERKMHEAEQSTNPDTTPHEHKF